MTDSPSINLDAQFLRDFARRFVSSESPDFSRLRQIASHLESMDEKLAARVEGDYSAGLLEGQRRAFGRSNLVDSRTLSVRDGKLIEEALASGKKNVIPLGQRAKGEPRVIIAPAKGIPARKGFRLEDLI